VIAGLLPEKDFEMSEIKLAVRVDERDHAHGRYASVTVVNYGDYQCPDCHGDIKKFKRWLMSWLIA
jgi:protein-disulfide isomerase